MCRSQNHRLVSKAKRVNRSTNGEAVRKNVNFREKIAKKCADFKVSQTSSPQPQQQKPLTGGFGQGHHQQQRSYYNRAMHPQQLEHPPPARGGF